MSDITKDSKTKSQLQNKKQSASAHDNVRKAAENYSNSSAVAHEALAKERENSKKAVSAPGKSESKTIKTTAEQQKTKKIALEKQSVEIASKEIAKNEVVKNEVVREKTAAKKIATKKMATKKIASKKSVNKDIASSSEQQAGQKKAADSRSNNDFFQIEQYSPEDTKVFINNIYELAKYYGEFWKKLSSAPHFKTPMSMPNDNHFMQIWLDGFIAMLGNPQEWFEAQQNLWQNYMSLYDYSMKVLSGKSVEPIAVPLRGDRRFNDELWQENIVFDVIKQSYLIYSDWFQKLIKETDDDLDPKISKQLEFYVSQYLNAISPSNFATTNPKIWQATLQSRGQNLVDGMKHLLEDFVTERGFLDIAMSDRSKFKLGDNIAASDGKVVMQNDLLQLIEYTPRTKQIYENPVMITPAWINKFYVLDLQEKNSLVRWLLDKGYKVFMISWINPDESYRDTKFEDYIKKGIIAAAEFIRKISRYKNAQGKRVAPKVNAVGYCLGGTALAMTQSYLAQINNNIFNSTTYLTTLIDFSDCGEISVFIDEYQISAIEERINKIGYMPSEDLSSGFRMLRSNDLIWNFVVNNYLLGKDPFPFDLLYWNMDGTRLPAKMHGYYLRNMYLDNKLINAQLKIDDIKIDVSKNKIDSYIVATKEDHIAPWKSVYSVMAKFGDNAKFILAGSGHIAGIINPPAKNKYSYYTNENIFEGHSDDNGSDKLLAADQWLESSEEHEGSWWHDWESWLSQRSGNKIAASEYDNNYFIEDAPGSYVLQK